MARCMDHAHWFLGGCLVWFGLVGGGFPVAQSAAATRMVTSLADNGTGGCQPAECTLREAIAAAQAGDTIRFDAALFRNGPGTITLTAGELVINKDLKLKGPGQNQLLISGNDASRVLRIVDHTVTIEKVTIAHGRADFGGGAANIRGTLTLRQSTVRDNNATLGGGLSNESAGSLTLIRSTVRGNVSGSSGGGLANSGFGEVRVLRSTVKGNRAAEGGGVSNTNRGTLTLIRSTVSGNRALEGGGLLNANSGTMTLEQSTVSGNRATLGSGGGISNSRSGTLLLEHSTVSSNRAVMGGGLSNGDPGQAVVANTIIAGNTARDSDPDCQSVGILESADHNLFGAGTGCDGALAPADRTVDPDLVFTDVLGPLQDNGGPTLTHALLAGSPALNKAEANDCPATDQRGVRRPQGRGCDIGAFEREVP